MLKPFCRTRWNHILALLLSLSAFAWAAAGWLYQPAGGAQHRASDRLDRTAAINEAYGRIPLHFEANQGQTDERVAFITRGRGYTMFLTATEAVLTLSKPHVQRRTDRRSSRDLAEASRPAKRSVLRMTYSGANTAPRVVGLEELRGRANYFKGSDPAKWRTNVPTYTRVRYDELYPGIDLVYYGNQQALEYDFVVKPGADPARIALRFDGAERIAIDDRGDLVLHTDGGALRQPKPFVYQTVDGERREVHGRYAMKQRDTVGFEIDSYDANLPLVIDPTLFYSTYVGGSDDETGNGIAVDSAGSAYITGTTASFDFPLANASQPVLAGTSDVYITKLNATGSALEYSTFFGGSGGEVGDAIAVDALGRVYITGNTNSSDLPTSMLAADQIFNGGGHDAYVAAFDETGAMLYSTYLGGTDFETGLGIAVDASGNAYATGTTRSLDFPTTLLAFQGTHAGDADAFVTKLNAAGTVLLYSTFLGGSSTLLPDVAFGIAVDGAGSAYVIGQTGSTDFPTTPLALQTTLRGGSDTFVTKVSSTGSSLVYSTYLGGDGGEGGTGIAVDALGNAFLTGTTDSDTYPTTPGAFDTTYELGDPSQAFVTKLDALGSGLIYSTYLGGSDLDDGFGIKADADGNAHVAGRTTSTDFPIVAGAVQSAFAGAEDLFVATVNAAGTALVSSTYFGGTDFDANPADIAIDDLPEPNQYIVGGTTSVDLPITPGAFSAAFNGGSLDVFVAQITGATLPPGPTAGRITGRGEIFVAGGNNKGKFHIAVERDTDGTVGGRVQYKNHGTGASMKSATITTVTINGNTAQITGTCGALCTFTVDVTDVDDTGDNDTFSISWPGGSDSGTLQKGDIQIQTN